MHLSKTPCECRQCVRIQKNKSSVCTTEMAQQDCTCQGAPANLPTRGYSLRELIFEESPELNAGKLVAHVSVILFVRAVKSVQGLARYFSIWDEFEEEVEISLQ